MFCLGFEKVAMGDYDHNDHMAELLATDHKHVARKNPQGYALPSLVMGGLGAALGGLAGGRGAAVGGALAGAATGALLTATHNHEIQEAKKTRDMSDSERKAYYRGAITHGNLAPHIRYT